MWSSPGLTTIQHMVEAVGLYRCTWYKSIKHRLYKNVYLLNHIEKDKNTSHNVSASIMDKGEDFQSYIAVFTLLFQHVLP